MIFFAISCVFAILRTVASQTERPPWAKSPAPLIYDRYRWTMQWVEPHADHKEIFEPALANLRAENADATLPVRLLRNDGKCPTKFVPGFAMTCEPLVAFDNGQTNEATVGRVFGLHFANKGLGNLVNGSTFVQEMTTIPGLTIIDLRNNNLSGDLFSLRRPWNLEYFDISLNRYDAQQETSALLDLREMEQREHALEFCRILDMSDREENCLMVRVDTTVLPKCGPPSRTVTGFVYNGCPSGRNFDTDNYFSTVVERNERAGLPRVTPYVGARSFKVDAPTLLSGKEGQIDFIPVPSSFEPGGVEYDLYVDGVTQDRTQGTGTIFTTKIESGPADTEDESVLTAGMGRQKTVIYQPKKSAFEMEEEFTTTLNQGRAHRGSMQENMQSADGALREPEARNSAQDNSYVLIIGTVVGACAVVALFAGILAIGYKWGKGRKKDRDTLQNIENALHERQQAERYGGGTGGGKALGPVHAGSTLSAQNGSAFYWEGADNIYGRVSLSPRGADEYGLAPPPIAGGEYDCASGEAAHTYDDVRHDLVRKPAYSRADTPLTMASSLVRAESDMDNVAARQYDRVSDTLMRD